MAKKSLNVLLISPLPPPAGGIASWTKQYIEWSNDNYLNVEIVNTAVTGKRAKKINSSTRLLDEIKRTKDIINDLINKINQFKPNIIHLNTPCGKFGIFRDYFCARISKKSGVKLFVHYRCNIEDQLGNKAISGYFLKKIANIADVNLVLNSSSKEYLQSISNCESTMVTNFINDDFLLRGYKNIKDEIKIISFVGHIQRSKGIFEIIDTARKLPGVTFKLAGPVALEINKVEKPPNIIFMGLLTKQEIKELLIESDIFLFPSHTEGFSNAMLEAMALGLPIIATPVGANIDMIESSGGIIVEINDSIGIVDAINSMKELKVRLKISRWNVEKVKNEYTTEKVMNKLIALYSNEIYK